jgi:hypothetical protein
MTDHVKRRNLSDMRGQYQNSYHNWLMYAVSGDKGYLLREYDLSEDGQMGGTHAMEDVAIGASRYADVRMPYKQEFDLVNELLSACRQ